jgi:DNA-binding XRE family transcriptional regulator
MLGVLGSSVNMGTRTPTVLPRHRPGTWLLKPIRDASMFREPTPLSAFATTREDVGYLLDSEMVARTEALASWIREHREAFACSQQEFAEESGISRATLSKIEQGHSYPSMQVRRKLAKALGVGPQELWNTRPEGITDRGEESTKQAS